MLATLNPIMPHHYAGLSGAVKPTNPDLVEYGATYYETDTGLWFIYTAAGWVQESSAVIAAGEAHLGEVGNNIKNVIVTPTITAGAYAANDLVGGKLEIPTAARASGGTGILQTLTVIDKAKVSAPLSFFFFSSLPGTYADNDAEAISAADALLNIGQVNIGISDYKAMANYHMANIQNIGLLYTATVTSLWFIVVAPEIVTYAATSNLQFRFGLLRN